MPEQPQIDQTASSDAQPTPQPTPAEQPATAAQGSQAPDVCPSCGGTLKDVPDVTDSCPHCFHVFANLAHFGVAHFGRIPRQLRDGDPEVQANVSADGLDYVGPKGRA